MFSLQKTKYYKNSKSSDIEDTRRKQLTNQADIKIVQVEK